MSAAALATLQSWHWPGNVRELRQVVETATVMLHAGEALDRRHLPARMQELTAQSLTVVHPEPVRGSESDLSLEDAVRNAEASVLRAALERHDTPEAAWRALGVGKTTFYKKLREHGLGRQDTCGFEQDEDRGKG